MMQSLETRTSSAFVAVWLFLLITLQQHAVVTARDELSEWGRTVFRRSLRATWALWGGLTALHLLFWTWQYHFDLTTVLGVIPLAMTRFIRRESRIWAFTVFTLLVVGVRSPEMFSVTALLATAALARRAWLVARTPEPVVAEHSAAAAEMVTPYRVPTNAEPPQARELTDLAFVIPTGRGSLHRLMCGAALTMYLAIWTMSWTGGAWPAHLLALDVGLALVLLFGVWRLRARIALVPLSLGAAQTVLSAHLLPAPQGLVQWGATAIGLGFALLIVSIAVSYYFRRRDT